MSNFDIFFDQQKESHWKESLSYVLKMWLTKRAREAEK